MLALVLFAFLLAGIFVFLTQIWCQSRLYAHARSRPTKRTSAAQRCNEDALRLIFELCSESTLASAGCVCQQWMIPAQKELFSGIASSIPPRRGDALNCALIDAPRLRSYIRRVTIFVVDSDGLKRYSWLRMLPPHTLVSLQLNGFPTAALHLELANLLLTSSSLSTLRRLVICRPALGVPGVLEACCSSSFLEHLGVIFLGGPVTHSSILPFKRNLSRLSLRGPDFVEDMSVLIRACGTSLRWLDVELTHWPRSTGYTLLAAALREVPQLEYLYLRWPESHPTPFLDSLSTLLPNLRVLDAGAHVYTATFFSNLPPMLEILRLKYTQLYSAALPPNDMVDYAYFPAEAAVAGLSAHSALHTFTLSPSECSFIEFPALVTSRKSLRFRLVTPDCVQAKTLDLLGEQA
ncbi:hypothetical protein R3P38DRAFT_162553 [Favolaschia claudopus]|uniref:F-box domain-containing protein n=1 Tax=Favolaschia claudopus TaxID=2862362 RepID=A0AAW0D0L6_9AGAR